jgi:hypothetical protein
MQRSARRTGGVQFMPTRKLAVAAATFGALAALTAAAQVRAGGDKVAFPENYAKGVLYTTLDRPDNKQYRELYVSPPEAVDAAKEGKPLPSGTVLTLLQYRAVLGPDGNPTKDANGRFSKGELIGYAVMEKRAGWGAEYPDNVRNGDWEYQSFLADRKVNDKSNLTACFNCHKPLDKQDYVFSYDKLKTATR